MEVFKPILDFPMYEVSNLGRIRSLFFNKLKILKPVLTGVKSRQYKTVVLRRNKNSYSKLIHLLVAETFLNHTTKKNFVVDHIDNNPLNNNLNNLQVISHTENCKKDKINKTSSFTGVSWNQSSRKWVAMKTINNKNTYLGRFDTEQEALVAYQR